MKNRARGRFLAAKQDLSATLSLSTHLRAQAVLQSDLRDQPLRLIQYAVTGKDADRFKFKVPRLCNVELPYPCFRDGEAATPSQAVDIMGRLQLVRECSDGEQPDRGFPEDVVR